jgi:capsular exopolysaccharide synthesis family protein
MDKGPPAAVARPLGATLRAQWLRLRTRLRRQWWIVALTIALGVAWQAGSRMSTPRGIPSSSETRQAAPVSNETEVSLGEQPGGRFRETLKISRRLLLGLLAGLLAGGLMLLLIDRADDRLASSADMIERFSEPVLAQIPNVEHTRIASGLPLIALEDERYSYAEAFRSLRSSLIFMPNQREVKTLGVTSAIASEGKSTIASNLAITMSAAGARVLLVDADLRHGDLAHLFDAPDRDGVANVLREEISWQRALQPTEHDSLSLIPRGTGSAGHENGELLRRPLMATLVREFREEFDTIIFNMAPILGEESATKLAPQFDGTLIVVRAQFTSARTTRHALDLLSQSEAKALGLILNCVDPEMPDYYYYQYPKYHAA